MPFQFFEHRPDQIGERRLHGAVMREQLRQHRRNGDFRRAALAVVAFERDAEAKLGHGRAIDAFGAGLDEDAAGCRLHQPDVGAAGAGDEERLGHAGGEQPLRRLGAIGRKAVAGRHPGKADREISQRHRVGRDRAAVDAAIALAVLGAGDLRHRVAHHLLVGMIGADIAGMIDAGDAGRRTGSRNAFPSNCCAAPTACRPSAPARWSRPGSTASARRIRARCRRATPCASMPVASATCSGSPECEAQASASSLSPKP